MGRRIIDLSVAIQNHATEPHPPEITYFDHRAGARRLGAMAGVEPADFPDGMALASEVITLRTHNGTHVDAPWHYGPTSGDDAAKAIDEVPLDWLYGPGVVLDFRSVERASEIGLDAVKAALDAIGHELHEDDKVLLNTGTDRYWGSHQYTSMHPGLSKEATKFILDQGVKAIGIDAWGLDRPVPKMAEQWSQGRKEALWPSHFFGRTMEYAMIEKLANLDTIPTPTGFLFSALPVKIEHASAGWCRAVAIVEDAE